MRTTLWFLAGFAAAAATTAFGSENADSDRPDATAGNPAWEFALTAYPTVVRGGEDYTSAIATADRGPLHLEARYDYESIGARSVFIGWNLSGGEEFTWQLTPLLGGAWGTTRAFIPGLEASATWKQFDLYVEAEYVRASSGKEDSYVYAWTELGYRPAEWLRVGIAGQRTRIYGNGRDIQRGPFAQLTWERVTIGGYWFSPGSGEQIVVGMIGVTF